MMSSPNQVENYALKFEEFRLIFHFHILFWFLVEERKGKREKRERELRLGMERGGSGRDEIWRLKEGERNVFFGRILREFILEKSLFFVFFKFVFCVFSPFFSFFLSFFFF